MKSIFYIIRRFAGKYKGYITATFIFNLLTSLFSLFSFATIIPILQLLFGMDTDNYTFIEWSSASGMSDYVNILKNNLFWYLNEQFTILGPSVCLMWLGLFLVVMTLLKVGTAYLAAAALIPVRTGVLRDLRNQIYKKIVDLPIGFFTEERKGDIMSRMTNDVIEVEASIMSSLEIIFKNPLLIVIYISVLFTLSWELSLFVMILLPTAGGIIGKIGKSLKRKSLKGQEETGDLLSQIEETIGGLRVIKAFNAENKLVSRFEKLNDNIRETFTKIFARILLAHPVSELLGTAVIAVLLWFGGTLILNNNSSLSAPEFIYYLVIFYSIIQPFKDLSKAGYAVNKGLASLQRVDEILKATNPLKEPNSGIPVAAPKENQTAVEFKDVWFKYQTEWILSEINLKVETGKTVALVGQSGSGKSTMVDLIPRFWDVDKGNIYVNGIDIKEAALHDVRDLIGYVNQEAILFNDTIYNNITFGLDNVTREEVERAAQIANAHQFILATENGYDTNIGDRGSKLSGGQRQRISIARAILKNPPILILDEATSALDTESERLVQEAIENLMKNRTAIVIAHRLSTIKKADMICVLYEGRIVETGNHDELLNIDGYYKRLHDMQNL